MINVVNSNLAEGIRYKSINHERACIDKPGSCNNVCISFPLRYSFEYRYEEYSRKSLPAQISAYSSNWYKNGIRTNVNGPAIIFNMLKPPEYWLGGEQCMNKDIWEKYKGEYK